MCQKSPKQLQCGLDLQKLSPAAIPPVGFCNLIILILHLLELTKLKVWIEMLSTIRGAGEDQFLFTCTVAVSVVPAVLGSESNCFVWGTKISNVQLHWQFLMNSNKTKLWSYYF